MLVDVSVEVFIRVHCFLDRPEVVACPPADSHQSLLEVSLGEHGRFVGVIVGFAGNQVGLDGEHVFL